MTLILLSQQLFFEADIPCLQLNLPHGQSYRVVHELTMKGDQSGMF